MPVGGRQERRHRGVLAALVVDKPELDLGGVADLPGEAHLLARARAGASRMGEPPYDRFAAMEVERRRRSRIELDPDAAGEHGRAGGRLELERPALGARRDDDADLGVGRGWRRDGRGVDRRALPAPEPDVRCLSFEAKVRAADREGVAGARARRLDRVDRVSHGAALGVDERPQRLYVALGERRPLRRRQRLSRPMQRPPVGPPRADQGRAGRGTACRLAASTRRASRGSGGTSRAARRARPTPRPGCLRGARPGRVGRTRARRCARTQRRRAQRRRRRQAAAGGPRARRWCLAARREDCRPGAAPSSGAPSSARRPSARRGAARRHPSRRSTPRCEPGPHRIDGGRRRGRGVRRAQRRRARARRGTGAARKSGAR